MPDRGGAGGVPSLRHRAPVATQIHFNDAAQLLTSGSDYLKRMLQHEVAGSVMGLNAEPMSEEEILLLEEEVLPAIGRFIVRAEAIWEARERLRAQQHGCSRRWPEGCMGPARGSANSGVSRPGGLTGWDRQLADKAAHQLGGSTAAGYGACD